MAQYAVGSLAAMAHLNPLTPPPGIAGVLPVLGYRLSVSWAYLIALAAVIVGVHLVLVGVMVGVSWGVVVVDDSNLVVSRLLGGLVGEGGVVGEGREVARGVQEELERREGRGGIRFGVFGEEGRRRVELGWEDGGKEIGGRDRGGRVREGEYL